MTCFFYCCCCCWGDDLCLALIFANLRRSSWLARCWQPSLLFIRVTRMCMQKMYESICTLLGISYRHHIIWSGKDDMFIDSVNICFSLFLSFLPTWPPLVLRSHWGDVEWIAFSFSVRRAIITIISSPTKYDRVILSQEAREGPPVHVTDGHALTASSGQDAKRTA